MRRPVQLALLVLAAVVAYCATATAASPSLGGIQPRGGTRGATDVVLTFSGARLGDAQDVLAYYPGVTVKKLEVVNDSTLKVTVDIAADARLGDHAFRVRTATGVSDLRTFWVGALPVVAEVEPNTEFDKAQPIPLNVTVTGVVQTEDVDYFAVDCKKGQRLSVEVEGMRLGTTFFDPYVAILDSKRFELAFGDDSPVTRQDGGCSVVIPADGKYIVQIRESAFGGNGACQYRLHVGTFPRPTGVVPAGGKPGEEVELTFLGDPSGPIKQKVKLPAVADPNFRVHAQTPEGVHPSGLGFRLVDLPGVTESGANNTPTAATPGTAPGAFHGVVAKAGEVDFFKFPAKKGQVFDVRVFARQLGSPLDPVVNVGVVGGPNLAGNDDSGGPDSYIRVTAPDDKELAVWVNDHLQKGGPDYFYRIEVTPVQPSVATLIPRVDGNNPANQDRQTISVPKGNRYAALLQANRADLGGPLNVGLGQLPPGVTAAAEPMDAGLGLVPVVFEAKADAPVGGFLTPITATHTDPKVTFPAKTTFDAVFSVGQNNTPYQRHYFDRTAVAVTEAAPFKIDVIEPKVPVVQNGSYALKVKVTRAEGFKGAITVFPLFTPPGMGIQGSATIPAEATEAILAVNSAPNAGARKWKTAVTAVSDAGKGPVWTSSQLFTLEVAPPPVTLTAERPAVEQGANTQLFCKVAVAAPFEGKAKVKVLGLPAKVTTADLELTKDTKELAFPIAADKTSPAGKHGGVFCQVVLEQNGDTITLATGGTELRIDVPIAPKTAAAPPTPMAQPMPMPMGQPMRRLTRLEQLRQEQEAREKAGQPASPPPAPPPPAKKP
ncbi:PPC domain-containing protein [bacterium]|nr:PPC domain-containing protein [bacterium]